MEQVLQKGASGERNEREIQELQRELQKQSRGVSFLITYSKIEEEHEVWNAYNEDCLFPYR